MSIALPEALVEIIQQSLLTRKIHDALYPQQMFRRMISDDDRRKWEARIGETKTSTRNGIMPHSTRPRTPGQDPQPRDSVAKEQWVSVARTYNDTIDTDLPTSYVSIVNLFLIDANTMMQAAGRTLDHLVRNKLYNAYLAGNTYATANTSSSTTLPVRNLLGFRDAMQLSKPTPVSIANPLAITVNGTANTVVNVVPDSALDPDGPGSLILGTAISASSGQAVRASTRSLVNRVGGATTTNGITSSHKASLQMLRTAVKQLRSRNVPTHPDGMYHLVTPPCTEDQLFGDAEFQRLVRGRVDDPTVLDFELGRIMGVKLIRCNETPDPLTTNADDRIYADLTVATGGEAGLGIVRPILTGMGTIVEDWIPEGSYLNDVPGIDPLSNATEMVPVGFGYGAFFKGIRYLVRPPLDRLNNKVSQTWSWSGDFVCPTDSLTYTPEWFKRAVVMEHAES